MDIKKLLVNGMKKVNLLHKVISNRNINLSAGKLLIFVIRPKYSVCGKLIRIKRVLWNPFRGWLPLPAHVLLPLDIVDQHHFGLM